MKISRTPRKKEDRQRWPAAIRLSKTLGREHRQPWTAICWTMSHEIIDKNVLEARQAKMARSRQVQQDALAEAHRSRQEARSSEEARAVHDLLSALEADMAPTARRRRRTTRAAASGTGGGSSSSGVGRGSPSFGVGGAPFLGWVAPAPSAGASMTSAPRPTAARAPGRRKTVQEHNAEVDRMAAAKGVDLR